MAKKEKKAGNKEVQGVEAGPQEKQNERIAKAPPKPKPKSAADRRKDRIDGITKTVYAAALGVIAGFACYFLAGALGTNNWQIGELPWHFVMMSVILITSIIQRFTYSYPEYRRGELSNQRLALCGVHCRRPLVGYMDAPSQLR